MSLLCVEFSVAECGYAAAVLTSKGDQTFIKTGKGRWPCITLTTSSLLYNDSNCASNKGIVDFLKWGCMSYLSVLGVLPTVTYDS